MMTWVAPFKLYSETLPSVPTLTVTAFGRVTPGFQLRLDDCGLVSPVGQIVRNESAVPSVTVTLRTTASTLLAGTPTAPVTSTSRVSPAAHFVLNGPTWKAGRESMMRPGGRAWK